MNTTRTLKSLIFSSILILGGFSGAADVLDSLKSVVSGTNGVAGLGTDEITGGLKEALNKGIQHAVTSLGHTNGFLTNMAVKIPMPSQLQKVESALRVAGQGPLVDEFVVSMNRAAEQAIPIATSVFVDAMTQMSIADAQSILNGPSNAATQYFRRTTRTNLQARFTPIVKKATDSVGVTAKYKEMTGKFDSVNSLGSLFGSKTKINLDAADIDTYVTGKAMDGLFILIAAEEKNIRANPLARSTDLLKKVFGATGK